MSAPFVIPLGFTIAHGTILTYGWAVFGTFAIAIQMCKHRQFGYWLHPLIMGILFTVSLAFMVSMLVLNLQAGTLQGPYQTPHNIIGYILIGQMTIVTFGGVILRTLTDKTAINPEVLKWLKFTHKLVGYQVWALFMVQAVLGWIPNKSIPQTAACIAAAIAGFLILLGIFAYRWFRTQRPFYEKCSFVNPEDLQGDFFIFDDYVYSLKRDAEGKLESFHPGGRAIIDAVNKREVDRFIYGMYAVQTLDSDTLHTHQLDCMRILDRPPFAKLIQPFLLKSSVDWWLYKEIQIGREVFIVLFNNRMSKFTNRVDSISWLGKYYLLYSEKRTRMRRLYTQVICLTDVNRTRTQQLLKYIENRLVGGQPFALSEFPSESSFFPLCIKRYPQGKFTNYFFNHKAQEDKYFIEGPKGRGLQLRGAGTYLIVAGGTGILPFADLLFMLLVYSIHEVALSKFGSSEAQRVNVFKEDLGQYKHVKVVLIATFPSYQDFLLKDIVEALYLLNQTFGLQNFDMQVRLSKGEGQRSYQLKGKSVVEAAKEVASSGVLTSAWVCGPPGLNKEAMASISPLVKPGAIWLI